MVVKHAGQRHFTKDLGGGSTSDRTILPGPDQSRVKTTVFTGMKGSSFTKVRHPVDETAFAIRGRARIVSGSGTFILEPGDHFYLPAGEVYDLECLEEIQWFCVFSQAADGTLPSNEHH